MGGQLGGQDGGLGLEFLGVGTEFFQLFGIHFLATCWLSISMTLFRTAAM